jgi:hypothetical protein
VNGINKFEDFYTRTAEELDEWLDIISRKGILTEIHEDFEFLREVGEGSYAKVYIAR